MNQVVESFFENWKKNNFKGNTHQSYILLDFDSYEMQINFEKNSTLLEFIIFTQSDYKKFKIESIERLARKFNFIYSNPNSFKCSEKFDCCTVEELKKRVEEIASRYKDLNKRFVKHSMLSESKYLKTEISKFNKSGTKLCLHVNREFYNTHSSDPVNEMDSFKNHLICYDISTQVCEVFIDDESSLNYIFSGTKEYLYIEELLFECKEKVMNSTLNLQDKPSEYLIFF